ncbi:hypothetical protein FQA39_LY01200 [Lamprigera yunnana]|nr:hypothetical protein FQA39_LY01200 [Lamprigera yunnana]
MNGPTQMYKTRQIIKHDVDVVLPNCMYGMKNIHAYGDDVGPLGDHISPFEDSANISNQVMQVLKSLQDCPEMNNLIERQERILQQLDVLRQQMIDLKTDLNKSNDKNLTTTMLHNVPMLPNIVINANPQYPPYSLLLIKKICGHLFNISITTHLHSSVSALPECAHDFINILNSLKNKVELPTFSIRLIWKNVGPSLEFLVSKLPITGEPNMLRFLARLVPGLLRYENETNLHEIDSALDLSYCLAQAKTKTDRMGFIQALNKKLGKGKFMCNSSELTIADIAAYSAVKQITTNEITQNMSKWLQRCETN